MRTNNYLAPVRKIVAKRSMIFFTLVLFAFGTARAQTTGFTFQGKLIDGTTPANGSYDFQFELFDAIAAGTQLGQTLTRNAVQITDGVFTVALDFENQFPGEKRFLEIRVRQIGAPKFTALTPRQEVNSSPYGIQSLNAANAATATNATQLGGIIADQYVVTTDPRMTDPRDPAPGSGNYVQNTTSPQATSNFNISGTGTAGILNAGTQYNIGGSRVLSTPGTTNTFAGISTGAANSTGSFNSFFGFGAGAGNTTGSANSFFGHVAGASTTTGENNAFFGTVAGFSNTTGSHNSFFGYQAGDKNTTGSANAFFGSSAGFSNTTGEFNSFLGFNAGTDNTTGSANSFFGHVAGVSNTTGGNNAFFGAVAGFSNTTGSNNSFFGYQAGDKNTIGSSNAFFGKSAGFANTLGNSNAFFGANAGEANTVGEYNAFFGKGAGFANAAGTGNTFLGRDAGDTNVNGLSNTIVGSQADVGSDGLTFATAIGAGSIVTQPNRVQLGRNGADTVSIGTLASGGAAPVCILGTVLSSCSSSIRYKRNVRPFASGLDLIDQLRPVTFDWKGTGQSEIGLIAEEVAGIDPRLTFTNQKGEIEGIKYGQLAVILINAVKQQQATIEEQQRQIYMLKQWICERDQTVPFCTKPQ